MIRVENIEVWGFEHAIRGMRNPLNSWSKSDSHRCRWEKSESCDECEKLSAYNNGVCIADKEFYCVGTNDLDLMKRLFNAGTEHRKYLRQIFVSMDIVAPLYWWKEFDTYKVGTVANSCSTMHKIAAKPFEMSDFSHEKLGIGAETTLKIVVDELNTEREMYLQSHDKGFWWGMIQLLPSSYNQRRTVTMNYENVFAIIKQRSGHKLDEWNEFIKILKTLPYVIEIGGMNEKRVGKWIINKEYNGYETIIKDCKCPFCNEKALLKKSYSMDGQSIVLYPSNYCPNCGAKMEVEENG